MILAKLKMIFLSSNKDDLQKYIQYVFDATKAFSKLDTPNIYRRRWFCFIRVVKNYSVKNDFLCETAILIAHP